MNWFSGLFVRKGSAHNVKEQLWVDFAQAHIFNGSGQLVDEVVALFSWRESGRSLGCTDSFFSLE